MNEKVLVSACLAALFAIFACGQREPDELIVGSWVIDEAARADPNPGYRTFQRLNRAEYAATGADADHCTAVRHLVQRQRWRAYRACRP